MKTEAGPRIIEKSVLTPPNTTTEWTGESPECCIIDKSLSDLRNEVSETLCELQVLADQCDQIQQSRLLRDSIAAANGPFRFMILGEVKSGKSSFVNALLGVDICKVAPEPCTDAIQEINYGEEETSEVLGPNRKRIRRPIDLLKRIAIVDTPGTNSVVKDHELISREYIPHSDLVIFVFEAKNPYRGSAWELLQFVRGEWGRKVIFVLQQMDLDPQYLGRQIQGVHDYAVKEGITSPLIFATSAEWERQGLKDRSGMAEVRQYIRETITGGRHVLEKLEGHLCTGTKVLTGLRKDTDAANQKLAQDRALRNKVSARLGRGRDRSTKEVEALVARLSDAYDAITGDFKEEFRSGMDTWSVVRRSLPGATSHKEWLSGMKSRFEATLHKRITQAASEESHRFIEAIKSLIVELLDETKKGASPTETAGSLGKLELQRKEIIDAIRAQLEDLARDQEPLIRGLSEASGNVGKVIMGGSLLAAIGMIITLAAQVIIFDITGGVLTMTGLLTAGLALIWKRGKIIEQFCGAIDQAKVQFVSELRDKLSADLRGIYSVIDDKFSGLDGLLESQEKELLPKLKRVQEIEARLTSLQNKVAGLIDTIG